MTCSTCWYASELSHCEQPERKAGNGCKLHRARCADCGGPMMTFIVTPTPTAACPICDAEDIAEGFGYEPGDAHYHPRS